MWAVKSSVPGARLEQKQEEETSQHMCKPDCPQMDSIIFSIPAEIIQEAFRLSPEDCGCNNSPSCSETSRFMAQAATTGF